AATRLQQQPDGTYVQLSPRTIESWYYAYRHGGFQALFPQDRSDRGCSRVISAEIAEQILRVKRERPRRSIRRIIRMLERAQIVGATRFVPHSYFALSESAVDQEYGFQQALLKHGLPRNYYVDLGAAYIADSLQLICAELGIRLLHTQVQDCEAKGVIERWH